jgi:hypothetical protein
VVLWGIAGLALLVAVAAVMLVRRVSRKLEALNQSYWELRYDYTRLRSQLSRLDPGEPETAAPPPAPAGVTFVPLSSMKKKNG